MSKFTASLIGGQNLIFRPFIEVNDDNIRFKIPGFLSGDEQTMKIENITDIRISGDIISKSIEIYSSGLGLIKADGFSGSDAKQIKSLIDFKQQELKRNSNNNQNNKYSPEHSEREVESKIDETRRKFTYLEMIPLIRFKNNNQSVLDTLNSLIHYVKTYDAKEKKEEGDFKYITAYSEKINEGLRFGNSLDGNEYFKNELKRVEREINLIDNKVINQTELIVKKKKKGKIVKYCIYGLIIFYIIRIMLHR